MLMTMVLAGCSTARAPTAPPVDTLAWAREPLTQLAGDAQRGRAIVASRQLGLCVLCHAGPFPDAQLHGNLAPSLAGVGRRLGAVALRARMMDSNRVKPGSIMPSYFKPVGDVQGEAQPMRVPPGLRGRPLLQAQEIEDVVAYLQTI